MHPMVHHIEKYSSETLFEESDMTFLNATGEWIIWLVRKGFDCYRTISERKKRIFKLLENWKFFKIHDAFVACGQLFPLRPVERPVMKHYVIVYATFKPLCIGIRKKLEYWKVLLLFHFLSFILHFLLFSGWFMESWFMDREWKFQWQWNLKRRNWQQ